jgi:hypothetical protein
MCLGCQEQIIFRLKGTTTGVAPFLFRTMEVQGSNHVMYPHAIRVLYFSVLVYVYCGRDISVSIVTRLRG